jgi:hypothetical protein
MEENGNGNAQATKSDIAELKLELTALRTELRQDIQATNDRLTEQMRDIETNMLSEFHRYAKGVAQRLHTSDTIDGEMKERLHLVEERLLELERRIRPHS